MNLREVLDGVRGALNFDKRIYCGFSANVDVVVGVANNDFLDFQRKIGVMPVRRDRTLKPPLCSREEIIDYVAWYIARGKGCDADVRRIESMSELMDKPGNLLAIGGTGAQASNWLAHAGFRNLFLSTPFRGPELDAVLDPGITIFDNNAEYAKDVADLAGFPDVHCIIDYSAGAAVGFGDGTVVEAPKANRAMLSQDRCCSRLTVAPGFKNALMREKSAAALLVSGYSTPTTEQAFFAFVDESAELIKAVAGRGSRGRFVHIEECHMWGDEAARRKTVTDRIYPLVDSVGMNEEELADLIAFFGLSEEKSTAENLKEMALRFGIGRVCMHGADTAVTVTREDPDRERTALALAVLLSASRGYYGGFVPADDIFALPERLAGITERKNAPAPRNIGDGYAVVELPTLYGMPLRSSIGLGDAFAGGVMGVL